MWTRVSAFEAFGMVAALFAPAFGAFEGGDRRGLAAGNKDFGPFALLRFRRDSTQNLFFQLCRRLSFPVYRLLPFLVFVCLQR